MILTRTNSATSDLSTSPYPDILPLDPYLSQPHARSKFDLQSLDLSNKPHIPSVFTLVYISNTGLDQPQLFPNQYS